MFVCVSVSPVSAAKVAFIVADWPMTIVDRLVVMSAVGEVTVTQELPLCSCPLGHVHVGYWLISKPFEQVLGTHCDPL